MPGGDDPLVRDYQRASASKFTDDLAKPAHNAAPKNDACAGLEIEWSHHR
jgi:hypothetical protein